MLGSIGSLFFVLVVNFFLFRVLPGDPARTLGRGRFQTAAQLDAFRHTYGLDQPLPRQFLTFLQNTFTGDLGISLRYRVPVTDLIMERLWPTVLLVGTSTILAMLIGVYVGMVERLEPWQALRQGLDRVHADALLDAGVVAGPAADRRLRGRARPVARDLPDRGAALDRRRPDAASPASSTRSGT